MTMAANELYWNVTRLCKQQKLQQKDLAAKMGIAPAALSKALSGNPTLDTIRKMAFALNVPMSSLLEARDTVDGYIRINGKTHHVVSKDEIITLLKH